MGIQNQIDRIIDKRNQALTKVASKGVTVPSGSTIDDLPGLIDLIDVLDTFTVTKTLTNVTTTNDDTKVIAGNSFYTKLTPLEGYNILSVIVTMDGIDITNQVFKPGTGEKVITANGTYNASEDDFSGYDSVIVSVPNSYSSSDEGKVVSNGALVAQTSDTVTQNGTVDTTLINSLTINVSGSITPTGTKQIAITENGTVTEDVTNYANAEISVNVENGLPYNVLLISSLFNSKYQHNYIRTGSAPTVSNYYSSGILIQGGASRVQKAYLRIGPVDLTNIKSIQSVTSYSSSNTTKKSFYSRLYISQNATDAAYEVPADQLDTYRYTDVTTGLTDVLRTLDVSGFTGDYYIFTGTDTAGDSWSATRNVTVHTVVFSEENEPFFATTQEDSQ